MTARSVVRSHHERWDGTGYPDRLAGSAIPPEVGTLQEIMARVRILCSVYDPPDQS